MIFVGAHWPGDAFFVGSTTIFPDFISIIVPSGHTTKLGNI